MWARFISAQGRFSFILTFSVICMIKYVFMWVACCWNEKQMNIQSFSFVAQRSKVWRSKYHFQRLTVCSFETNREIYLCHKQFESTDFCPQTTVVQRSIQWPVNTPTKIKAIYCDVSVQWWADVLTELSPGTEPVTQHQKMLLLTFQHENNCLKKLHF